MEIKKSVNLTGVICPMNFVKTKAALADLLPGELLEVILDEGDAILNVPRSLKDEGHKILQVENLGETFKVVVEKGVKQ
ncbi:MAG: sulfurtransferase TusA family protein [Candidatus Margulisiibacteriota bacterium]|jgi:tRNA 2-thiouridine synthesizing protein A